jgi:hypothetical protein
VKVGWADDKRLVWFDEDEVRGSAFGKPARLKSKDLCWSRCKRPEAVKKRCPALVVHA